jgi:FkbM family methyltransferase
MKLARFKKVFKKGKLKKWLIKRAEEALMGQIRPEIKPLPFKKWELVNVNSKAPSETGWGKEWHGYWQLKETRSDLKRMKSEAIQEKLLDKDIVRQGEVEKHCFISLVDAVKEDEVKIFELGAGRGDWCLALAGIVDFNLIPSAKNKTYKCLAIEAEPTHYGWTNRHFVEQKINGYAVHGAVGKTESESVGFDTSEDPATVYGQAIDEDSSYRIKGYTVDQLIKKYGFPKVNIIHMDVQGSELDVMHGAKDAIQQGLIDYWLIGTHSKKLEKDILEFAQAKYNTVFYIPEKAGEIQNDQLGKIFIHGDGILILERKDLV